MIRASHIETARALGAAPAVPPGGAQAIGGRDCGLIVQSFLMFSLAVLLLAALSVRAHADSSSGQDAAVAHGNLSGAFVPVPVPSGQRVLLAEVLLDESPGALWARFRFVAPEIRRSDDVQAGGGTDAVAMTFERSAPDMDHLCDSLALEYLRQHDLAATMVVISLSDRPVTFGTQDPEATQFFEAYRPDGDSCIWEAF
jgi:hypothetical protein